jgi:hypothetical protein
MVSARQFSYGRWEWISISAWYMMTRLFARGKLLESSRERRTPAHDSVQLPHLPESPHSSGRFSRSENALSPLQILLETAVVILAVMAFGGFVWFLVWLWNGPLKKQREEMGWDGLPFWKY